MLLIATHIACFCDLSVSHCMPRAHWWALQKRLDWFRFCFGGQTREDPSNLAVGVHSWRHLVSVIDPSICDGNAASYHLGASYHVTVATCLALTVDTSNHMKDCKQWFCQVHPVKVHVQKRNMVIIQQQPPFYSHCTGQPGFCWCKVYMPCIHIGSCGSRDRGTCNRLVCIMQCSY